MKKNKFIVKLFKKKFFILELERIAQKACTQRFIEYFTRSFICDVKRYRNSTNGWVVFTDSFQSLDIWQDDRIISSIYKDENGLYIEPSCFISNLIMFIDQNY